MDRTILWLTGLSGSGKTTLATAVAARLRPLRPVEILDGDEIRKQLSPELGFTREDRELNVWRIGFVARLLARHRRRDFALRQLAQRNPSPRRDRWRPVR